MWSCTTRRIGADADPTQYLMTETLDTYNGQNTWTESPSQAVNTPANQLILPAGPYNTYFTDTYDIVYDQKVDPTHLLAPGVEARSFNVDSQVFISSATKKSVSYASQKTLTNGSEYQAEGYVSDATVQDLRAVPYPQDLTGQALSDAYPASLLNEYLPSSPAIDPQIMQLAQNAAKGTTNMYDAANALEDYLRTFTYSLESPTPPPGEDAVEYFLDHSKTGFCSYFASAMALMGRALGMPTRLALGFTNGVYDAANQSYRGARHPVPRVDADLFPGLGLDQFRADAVLRQILEADRRAQPASQPRLRRRPQGRRRLSPPRPKGQVGALGVPIGSGRWRRPGAHRYRAESERAARAHTALCRALRTLVAIDVPRSVSCFSRVMGASLDWAHGPARRLAGRRHRANMGRLSARSSLRNGPRCAI